MANVLDRFWAKVEKRGPDECWIWNAGCISTGYGSFYPRKNEPILAHRFAYALAYGPIPEGMKVDHTCHNNKECPPGPCIHRLCCNPAHLEAVPNRVNVNRSHNSNIRKTHCPSGHAYTPENTYLQHKATTTSRVCRECARERDRQPHRNAALRRRIYKERASHS